MPALFRTIRSAIMFSLAAGSWGLCGGSAWGHPGHGTTDPEQITHYVFEPLHVAPAVVLGLLALAGLAWRWQVRAKGLEVTNSRINAKKR